MFLLIGLAAGALTGVPIGPANVAVIDAAYRFTLRRAVAVALGAAIADGVYAAAGMLGVTPLLRAYPTIPPILNTISGIILLAYGFLTARSQPVQPATPAVEQLASDSVVLRKQMWSGFSLGLALILLNPAAIVTWVVVIGPMVPDGNRVDGTLFSIGVTIGSFGWFSLVAYLTQKGKNVLGDKAAWIPRVVGMLLMGYAVYLLVKAVKYVVS